MIVFRVELWCNGPACLMQISSYVHDDEAALPELTRNLIESAKSKGWTLDGAAHWCPKCTLVRKAAENGKLGSAA